MNKLIKKVTAVALSGVLMSTALVGCSSSTQGDSSSNATDSDKVYKVGICQLVQHDALDAATQGFEDALTEILGDKVEFDLQNAGGDSPTCATITNQFVADGVDLIMANATASLQAAMTATDSIPIVATSITDYATALEITDWTGKTGINVTGTSDLAPLADQAAMVKELCPDAKTVGILYCSAEANSKYQADVISAEFADLGLDVKVYTCADTNEIASITTQACGEVDVIYIPTDNTIASATSAVNEIASPANIPVITGEEGICKGCGVATLSISYYSIGYEAGKMAAQILTEGANPAEMEIQYATELTKKYVPDRATALGITAPDGYEVLDITEE
jgi:putative ABC transport system substrate-binding protein